MQLVNGTLAGLGQTAQAAGADAGCRSKQAETANGQPFCWTFQEQ